MIKNYISELFISNECIIRMQEQTPPSYVFLNKTDLFVCPVIYCCRYTVTTIFDNYYKLQTVINE